MTTTTVTRTIHAQANAVFDTVAHIENFSKAVPSITRTEFLSDKQSGVGTRFRETRLMRGKEASTELEVTEYIENERVRIVADSHGTVWDTVFTVRQVSEDNVELSMQMDARSYKLLAKLLTPLMRRFIQNEIEKDMDSVKRYCEQKRPN